MNTKVNTKICLLRIHIAYLGGYLRLSEEPAAPLFKAVSSDKSLPICKVGRSHIMKRRYLRRLSQFQNFFIVHFYKQDRKCTHKVIMSCFRVTIFAVESR